MLLYEVRPKLEAERRRVERTYLVVAADTQAAQDMVVKRLKEQGGRELTHTDLWIRPASESAARQRQVLRIGLFTNSDTTAWKIYQECKRLKTAAIIADYIC